MKILDRMLFFAFLRSYCICLTSTLSLYIILDMFNNLDDFGAKANDFVDVLRNIFNYYSYRCLQYYDKLCEAIAMLAAVFTIAWMQRNNEVLPVLSAGVSTHRIIQPILAGTAVMLALGIANQELVIPRISGVLMTDRDDQEQDKEVAVHSAFDPNGVHIEGMTAVRKEQTVRSFNATLPDTTSSSMIHLSAQTARYIPPGKDPLSGGWLLNDTNLKEIDSENQPEMLTSICPGKYFLKTNDVTFEVVARDPKWFYYASTHRLYELLNKSDATRQAAIAVKFHMRLSRPVIGMLMVVLGLSIILRDQTRHMIISAGICLAMCAVFYGAVEVCRFLGNNDYLSPALAGWLPVLIFGPFTIVQFDAIHT
jgi:lipopolysaccharide export system permease protein